MDGWLTGSGRPKNPGGMYRRQEKGSSVTVGVSVSPPNSIAVSNPWS